MATATAATTAAAAIEHDLACGGCDYNLRGLPRAGACPECGHDIDATLHGLSPKRAAWLRRVSWGALLIGAGILTGGAGVGLVAWGGWWRLGGSPALPFYSFAGGAIVAAVGTWTFATTASGRHGWGYLLSGVGLRILGSATCLMQLYIATVLGQSRGLLPVYVGYPRNFSGLCEATAVLWAATAAMTCLRAAILAGRVGDRAGRVQAWLMGLLSVAVLGGGAMYWNTFGGWTRAYMAAAAVVAGWSIVFFVGFAAVLWRRARAGTALISTAARRG